MNRRYIIVDLEATCVENKDPNFQNETIEIGALMVDHNGKVLGEFQRFIKPKLNPILSDFCKELTTITQAEVDAAQDFKTVTLDFLDWCSKGVDAAFLDSFNNIWFCSWGQYDKNQFIKDCKLNGLVTYWINNHISLKHQHGAMIGIPRGVGMQAALRKLNLISTGTHHRGIDDARNITNIFLSLFERWKY